MGAQSENDAGVASAAEIRPEEVSAYLRRKIHPEAQLLGLKPLGEEVQEGLKAHGYGHPLLVRYSVGSSSRDLVLRTVAGDRFGHDRRADRVAAVVLDFDSFNLIPRHVQALDVGAILPDGTFLSTAEGEPFLVTTYVDGQLYAHDLKAAASRARADELDLLRVRTLARYLVELHRHPAPESAYARDIRDTIGHGEGIFGLADSYPPDDPVATPSRLEALERSAVAWRWKLRTMGGRSRRKHGDFHPFNILFREGVDFSVLDCSRGARGEPADDVTCLSVNFLFFSLTSNGRFEGALRDLWREFWSAYAAGSGDLQMYSVVAPFFAWRVLVLCSPLWYPNVAQETRARLLRFAERLLEGARFEPERIEEVLS